MPREWRFYLDDIIGFSEKVLTYTKGMDQKEFKTNSLIYDATLRNLELMEKRRHTFLMMFVSSQPKYHGG